MAKALITRRYESEIVRLLEQGMSTRAIASRLGNVVSHMTVQKIRQEMKAKREAANVG